MTTEEQQNNSAEQQTTQTTTDQATQAASQQQQTSSDSNSTDLGSDDQNSQKTSATSDATDLGADDEAGNKDQENPFKEYHGLPESGQYEAFTLPDGAEADPELNEKFGGLGKELGLSQKAMQKLVDFKTEVDQKTVQSWVEHKENLRNEAKKDPVIGGAKYDASVAAGRKSINHFMGAAAPQFRAMLNHYGVGAHPLMIRYMASVGKALGETTTIDPGAGSGAGNKDVPLHDILYQKQEG